LRLILSARGHASPIAREVRILPRPLALALLVGSATMDKDHIKNRLHDAMHRGKHKATEEELAEVTVVVLAIVGELALETAAIISELNQRVEALEART
jgi:hypothetical protein